MSIVKDFVLVLTVLFALIYCLCLKYRIKKQTEYFVNILKHDIKVPVLAEKHALELLDYTDSLIKNIKDSKNKMLGLINTAITAYENNFVHSPEKIILSDFIIGIFKSLDARAEDKKITFYYMINDAMSIYADKTYFAEVITYLTILLIQNSPKYGKIMCSAQIKNRILKLRLQGYSIKKINSTEPLKNRLMPVGHGIKMLFCKRFLTACKWKFKEVCDKNMVNSFTIEIPLSDKVSPPKIPCRSRFENMIPCRN